MGRGAAEEAAIGRHSRCKKHDLRWFRVGPPPTCGHHGSLTRQERPCHRGAACKDPRTRGTPSIRMVLYPAWMWHLKFSPRRHMSTMQRGTHRKQRGGARVGGPAKISSRRQDRKGPTAVPNAQTSSAGTARYSTGPSAGSDYWRDRERQNAIGSRPRHLRPGNRSGIPRSCSDPNEATHRRARKARQGTQTCRPENRCSTKKGARGRSSLRESGR